MSVTNGKVTLDNAVAKMTDQSTHQDDSRSWVTLVVFGIPKTA